MLRRERSQLCGERTVDGSQLTTVAQKREERVIGDVCRSSDGERSQIGAVARERKQRRVAQPRHIVNAQRVQPTHAKATDERGRGKLNRKQREKKLRGAARVSVCALENEQLLDAGVAHVDALMQHHTPQST